MLGGKKRSFVMLNSIYLLMQLFYISMANDRVNVIGDKIILTNQSSVVTLCKRNRMFN